MSDDQYTGYLFARGATVTHLYGWAPRRNEWICLCGGWPVDARYLAGPAPERRLCMNCAKATGAWWTRESAGVLPW